MNPKQLANYLELSFKTIIGFALLVLIYIGYLNIGCDIIYFILFMLSGLMVSLPLCIIFMVTTMALPEANNWVEYKDFIKDIFNQKIK